MTLNVLDAPAAPPFYIWANEDCQNKSSSLDDAKSIRLALVNDDCEDVYICDADGVEVVDAEISAHELLTSIGVSIRHFADRFVMTDPQDDALHIEEANAYALAMRGADYYSSGIGPNGCEIKSHLLLSDHEASLDEACFWKLDQGWVPLRDATRFTVSETRQTVLQGQRFVSIQDAIEIERALTMRVAAQECTSSTPNSAPRI